MEAMGGQFLDGRLYEVYWDQCVIYFICMLY